MTSVHVVVPHRLGNGGVYKTSISFVISGHYAPEGSVQQFECEEGTYQDLTAQPSCKECPPGFYCQERAMNYTVLCPPGFYCGNGTVVPDDCPPSTYSNRTGMSDISECLDCPQGKYCAERGAVEPSGNCRAGHICYGNALIADPVYNNDSSGKIQISS